MAWRFARWVLKRICFRRSLPSNGTRAMRHKRGRRADCGALEVPFICQNAHDGPDQTAAAYLHNQERFANIRRFGLAPIRTRGAPRQDPPGEPRPWLDHNAPVYGVAFRPPREHDVRSSSASASRRPTTACNPTAPDPGDHPLRGQSPASKKRSTEKRERYFQWQGAPRARLVRRSSHVPWSR